eukprot:241344-Amorphochlora_amoeboformis.AAC.2
MPQTTIKRTNTPTAHGAIADKLISPSNLLRLLILDSEFKAGTSAPAIHRSMSTSKPDSKSAPGLLGKGKELLKNKEYEKAVEVLGEALQMMVDIEGKVAKECAPYYFEYGQALLETSKATQALLGSKAAGEPEGENDEPSDLQIAWELFETCRVIYERQLAEEDSKKGCINVSPCRLYNATTFTWEIHLAMAEVYISLADISREEGKPELRAVNVWY